MDNQQDYILSNNQKQVILTGTFGDGHINRRSKNFNYQTNCIHKSYMEYKGMLLGSLWNGKVKTRMNIGYKKALIHSIETRRDSAIRLFDELSLEDKLEELDDLGVAMWFYDDGSLHKNGHFYNLNTHSFSKDIQEKFFVPFFKEKYGITAKIYPDRKKDGREFWYLSFSRMDSFVITTMLKKYYVSCFDYKMWSSETIQKWSKLLVELKSEGKVITPRLMGYRMNK